MSQSTFLRIFRALVKLSEYILIFLRAGLIVLSCMVVCMVIVAILILF